MADKKKPGKSARRGSAKPPQGRSPSFTINARINLALGQAFDRYVQETRPKPTITSALEHALEEFLSPRGYWPPAGGSPGEQSPST